MRHLFIGIPCALALIGVQPASARRGVNGAGQCVDPCTRSGFLCAPCLPRVGPGAAEWAAEVLDFEARSREFRDDVRAKADADKAYRASPEFSDDRLVARNLLRSVESMRAIKGAGPE